MTISVSKYIGGSYCVVHLSPHFWDEGLYIDARKDVRQPDYSFIEVVKNGRVIWSQVDHNDQAPEQIISLMRCLVQGKHPSHHKTL